MFRSAVWGTVLLGLQGLAAAEPNIDFEQQIRPLLIAKCGTCHGPDVQKGGLRLDVRQAAFKGGDSGAVLVPRKVDESELIRRITSTYAADRMPPKGPQLAEAEMTLLKRWIEGGAVWPESDADRAAAIDKRREHWAFQPLTAQLPPADPFIVSAQSIPSAENAIDLFLRQRLREHHLLPAGRADRRTLIRRLSFDLLGLPPDPELVEQFVNDTAADAWERLVEILLASPHYGERWAQHWLDVVRYADTHGFEVNTPRDNAWPYRDYVIQAFNDDVPYDRFVREQIAGDAIQADAATGFLVAAAVLLPGQIGADDASKRLARQDALDEIIQGTSGTFLGLTLGCARCHDHKFDPLTQRDYYTWQAFFAGVEYLDRPIEDAGRQQRLKTAEQLKPQLATLESRLRRLEPLARTTRTFLIDETDSQHTTRLQPMNGPGKNPPGTQRGHQDDPGTIDRLGNISGGSYVWWNNVPGQDVLTYNPQLSGRFRLWISWGAHGSGVHTRDARYLLDRDGDLNTRDDQPLLATIDQYYPAGVTTGETLQQPLWSGLWDAGVVDLEDGSKLILRGGDTGKGITADVIVLQELTDEASVPQPHLRGPINTARNSERFTPTSARFVRFTTFATLDNNRHEPCLDELEVFTAEPTPRNIARAADGVKLSSSGNYPESEQHSLKHINDGQYGNGRSWISNQAGGGWVQIEWPEAALVERIEWSRDRSGKFRDRLPLRYAIELSLDGVTWKTVATHADRQPFGSPYDQTLTLRREQRRSKTDDVTVLLNDVDRLRSTIERLETQQLVFAGAFRTPDETYLLRRGDPEQKVEPLGPAVPALFSPVKLDTAATEQQRRLVVADWIASPQNPLTARVMVNRLWQAHFGRGLVDTPNDFGLNGAEPSHPELLDWLALELQRSGWSLKHIHRLIVTSAAYQQAATITPQGAALDRDNRWLWRFTSRRLEGEAIRDTLLTITGEFNDTMGGPGYNFFQSRGGLNGFPPVESFTAKELRRMIYAHKVRMEAVPVFGAFDCPDAGQMLAQRSRSTTAIQALNLFNSSFMIDRAEHFAQRLQQAWPDQPDRQIEQAFARSLGRVPHADERIAIESLVREHGLSTLARVLFNTNEFLLLP